ncbi:MAG: M67 family metallopeptidase [Chloroflexota bacterium]|nr:M67 family metallopeptidase [Dehalococcoidia bacterium]MDW8254243.1 M67 family metallopeptidase [Chloroflexota bacterium]
MRVPPAPAERRLRLPSDIFWEMARHAREESPKEACGLVAGKDGRPVRVFRGRNIDPNPVVRYQIAPQDIIAFDKALEEQGWEWLGIYHSHTFSEAYPSPTDIANAITALSPGILYLILSLKEENAEQRLVTVSLDDRMILSVAARRLVPPTIRAFVIDNGAVEEVPIVIE